MPIDIVRNDIQISRRRIGNSMTAQGGLLEFPGSHGALLSARLDLPDGPPRAYALFAHCFTCSKDALAAARISRALTEFGIAVLRFDFTGLGDSGGDFANTNFSSNIEDLAFAADFLRTTYDAPSLLIGHSLGGAAVLAVTHRIPEIRAVVTIGAPADPDHLSHLLRDSRAEIEADGEAEVVLGGRTFRVRQQFLDDIAAQPQAERIRDLGVALLVMHSPVDRIVDVENARRIYEAARHPKSFVALDGADHLLTSQADAAYAASILATWAERYALGAAADKLRPRSLQRRMPPRDWWWCPRAGLGRLPRTSRSVGIACPLTSRCQRGRTPARHRTTCCSPGWARAPR